MIHRGPTGGSPGGPLVCAVGLAALLLASSACSGGSPTTGQGDSGTTSSPRTQSARPPTGSASTPTRLTTTPGEARADTGALLDSACYARRGQTSAPDPEDCSYGYFDGDTVVLYGDSHAAQWFGAAVEVAERHDWRLLPVTKADCPPGGERILDADLSRGSTECAQWHQHAMELIAEQEPILVLLSARSDRYRILGADGEPLGDAATAERLRLALIDDLRRFADMGARTILIRDTQVPGFDVPDCIEEGGPDACRYRLADAIPDDAAQVAAARATGTPVVDLRKQVCGARTQCRSAIDGLIPFRDAEHLTNTFAASLADELEAGIEALPA